MKKVAKDELYENLSEFLKGKGIELKEGQYTQGIHAGASLLADAVKMGRAGLDRGGPEVGRQLDQIRQVIHKKTPPKNRGGGTSASGPKKADTNSAGVRG